MSANPAWQPIAEMEADMADVERWGEVIHAMSHAEEVSPRALYLIGSAITSLGRRLEKQWQAAFDAAKVEGAQ